MAAKKPTSSKTPAKTVAKARAATSQQPPVDAQIAVPAALETPVRKSVMPKASPAGATVEVTKAPVPLTYERIAERAYHISRNGNGGSEYDNWLRAEAELKSENV